MHAKFQQQVHWEKTPEKCDCIFLKAIERRLPQREERSLKSVGSVCQEALGFRPRSSPVLLIFVVRLEHNFPTAVLLPRSNRSCPRPTAMLPILSNRYMQADKTF